MADLPGTQTQEDYIEFPSTSQEVNPPWGRLCSLISTLPSIELFNSTYTFGRSPDCDIVAENTHFTCILNISKEHFRLTRENDEIVYITDLSKNGTFINAKRVGKNNKYIIHDNDIISVGPTDRIYSFNRNDQIDYVPRAISHTYFVSRILGRGAFGEVRLAHNKRTLKQFAIKRVMKGRSSTMLMGQATPPQKIKTEVEILTTFSYPFIIHMEEVFETDDAVFLVLEYMQGGELTSRIVSNVPFPENEIKFIFYQILSGVRYLHMNGVTHRDLKPENVLLAHKDPYPMVKISDFGLSKIMDDISLMETTCGTISYVAPEILICGERYTKQVDVWSLGVLLHYMLTKMLPFMGADRSAVARRILSGKVDWDNKSWRGVSLAAKELLKEMLVLDSKQRISIGGVFNHSWVKEDVAMQYRVDQLMVSGSDHTVDSDASIGAIPVAKKARLTLSGDNFTF